MLLTVKLILYFYYFYTIYHKVVIHNPWQFMFKCFKKNYRSNSGFTQMFSLLLNYSTQHLVISPQAISTGYSVCSLDALTVSAKSSSLTQHMLWNVQEMCPHKIQHKLWVKYPAFCWISSPSWGSNGGVFRWLLFRSK